MYRRDSGLEFTARISTLVSHGIELPDEYLALQRRLTDFENIGHPLTDRLVDTVVNAAATKNVGVAQLYAGAVAENLDVALHAPVRHAVYDAAHARLRQIATSAAPGIYAGVADEWNTTAAELAQHADVTDLEAPSDAAHKLPEPERQAWIAGEQTAHRLDLLMPVLQAAGALAGLALDDPQGLPDEAALFALCCHIDTTVHRRAAWEAWQSRGRCDRWANLAALGGVTIKAASINEPFERYRQAAPIETVKQQAPGRPIGFYEYVQVDPEDNTPLAVRPMDPVRKPGRAVIA